MRNILLIALLFMLSCGDSENQKILLDSEGKINDVSVVIDNEMWEGSVGEAIRNILATPVYGLPQDEPTFGINQIPTNVFSGFITKSRTVLLIEMNKEASVIFANNVYAKPQKVVVVSG